MYSFNEVYWNLEEIKRVDKKIAKLMTLNRMHPPKVHVSRCVLVEKKEDKE